MGERDWLLVGVGVLIALLVVPSYCSDEPSPPGTVLLVGDSLSFQSADALKGAVSSDGWDAEVWAIPGASLRVGGVPPVDWSPATLRRLVGDWKPEVVFMELGTNGCGPGCTTHTEAVDDIMSEIDDVPVVLWLNARTPTHYPPDRFEVNNALDEADDRWDNLTVLSFDEWFDGHPEYVDGDNVHLTDAGELVLADKVRQAIRDHADVD